MTRTSVLLSVALSCGTAMACVGDDDDMVGVDAAFEPRLSAIQANVFDVSCVSSGCHSATSAAGGLVLERGMSYGHLVGVSPTRPLAAQVGLLRVKVGNPSQSYLSIKLGDLVEEQFGERMPAGSDELDESVKTAISQWISDGAENN